MKFAFTLFDVNRDWEYMHERALPKLVEDTCGIIAIDVKKQKPVACVTFDHVWQGSAHIHIAIDDPNVIRHGFFEACADYIFNMRGVQTLIGMTPAGNTKAVRFLKRAGFEEVYRIPDGFRLGESIVLSQMRKSDCPYLPQPQLHAQLEDV